MKIRIGLVIAAVFSLSGCGFAGVNGTIHDRSNDYLEAQSAQPLKYPKAMPAVSQKFTIPAGERATEPVSIKPPEVF